MQFDRFIKLVGEKDFYKIKASRITIIGLGGVGSYVFEALVRCGVNFITIIDSDKIDITNLNRQLMTNLGNVDQDKVMVLKQRALLINKDIKINAVKEFLCEENIELIFDNSDYIIDCCDSVNTKKCIILECLKRETNFITCMGMGNRLNPALIKICDLKKTYNDPLSKVMRKWLKDNNINKKIMCCSSSELPIKNNYKEIASSSFVPASAGLLIASYIINEIRK